MESKTYNPELKALLGPYVFPKAKALGPRDEGTDCYDPTEKFVLLYQPHSLSAALELIEKEGAHLSQSALKAHPNPFVRKASRLRKRWDGAALAAKATERFAGRAGTRLRVLAELVKQAAAVPEADTEARADAEATVTEMARAFVAAERRDAAAPLFVLQAATHDTAKGSRAIRRKVSHDFRKGRKPDPDSGSGSVRLDGYDLVALHGRFAANALGTEGYNSVLADAHAVGRLRHLQPLPDKGEAEPVQERKAA